ncbi:MAG: hypothetical protein KJ592_00840, partial [Nanoarchaeota archaeon]|nr:hypothetical protein [Nanoarchaeota archaeon]
NNSTSYKTIPSRIRENPTNPRKPQAPKSLSQVTQPQNNHHPFSTTQQVTKQNPKKIRKNPTNPRKSQAPKSLSQNQPSIKIIYNKLLTYKPFS